VAIEDGFFRSVRPGRDEPTLSYVCDPVGVHYDGARPSALEALTRARAADPAAAARDAAPALAAVRELELSKYNAFADDDAALAALPADPAETALVVDQTAGDAAVAGAGADAGRFLAMLAAAADENPGRLIAVRRHPDARWRGRAGHFTDAAVARAAAGAPALARALREGRVAFVEGAAVPARLLRRAGRVYVVSSQMGFEALLLGRPVACFGQAFYAGWGLTDDRAPPIPRRGPVPLEALAAAAFADYARYFSPDDRRPLAMPEALALLAARRDAARRLR
jgi:capsular polysaccharide export protein